MLRRLIAIALAVGGLIMTSGCEHSFARDAGFRTWQEEVRLNDGRVIVVAQKRRCEGAYTGQNLASCIERESWVTIRLPEFGNQEIVWNEKLYPMVLNVHEGQLYVVGGFPTEGEFRLYGKPKPAYVGFRWENGHWKRIAFTEIPKAIYDTNMVIDLPPKGTQLLALSQKESRDMNANPEYPKQYKRIDPSYKID
ncbi:MAG: hypothetical protein ACRERD_18010 [Candidatus Binatia bacterium]